MRSLLPAVAALAALLSPLASQDLGPLILEYNASGQPDDWTTEPTIGGAATFRTRGDLNSPGTWIHYVYRVHADPEYLSFDSFTAGQTYLEELVPTTLVEMGFDPTYAGFPEIVTDPADFMGVLLYALYPIDPDYVSTFCLPTLRPVDSTVLEAETIWQTDHFRWNDVAKTWWESYSYGEGSADIVNVEALLEFMILSQSKGLLDYSFFDTSYYKLLREKGLYIQIQAYGMQGALTDPSDYATSDSPGGDTPGGLLGWSPFGPRVTTTAAVTFEMAFTSPAVGGPGWMQIGSEMSFQTAAPAGDIAIPVRNRFGNPRIKLNHSLGMSEVVDLRASGPTEATFAMPAWPAGVVRGVQLINDVGIRNIDPENQYVFRLL